VYPLWLNWPGVFCVAILPSRRGPFERSLEPASNSINVLWCARSSSAALRVSCPSFDRSLPRYTFRCSRRENKDQADVTVCSLAPTSVGSLLMTDCDKDVGHEEKPPATHSTCQAQYICANDDAKAIEEPRCRCGSQCWHTRAIADQGEGEGERGRGRERHLRAKRMSVESTGAYGDMSTACLEFSTANNRAAPVRQLPAHKVPTYLHGLAPSCYPA
jgi:hypothetical protein